MATRELPSEDAIKTYRYLRIGMIGAVVLLAASILIEHAKVPTGCWQNSISAYYYTPVRAIFVGALVAVGLALIVIKGRTSLEDICLNFAGMLAPVVAIAPTTDVGKCWSIPPNPLPVDHGTLASWVVTNVSNNFRALLIAGAVGLVVAVVLALVVNQGIGGTIRSVDRGTLISLGVTGGLLALGWILIATWDGFYTEVHGPAAILMFAFLVGAVGSKVLELRQAGGGYFKAYATVGASMVLGALVIWLSGIFAEHTVFALEAFEISMFAGFWIIQTWENWNEAPPRAA